MESTTKGIDSVEGKKQQQLVAVVGDAGGGA